MTQHDFNRELRRIQRELKSGIEAEVRRRWREERQLIFVKTYTVHAHFRPAKPRQPKAARRSRSRSSAIDTSRFH